jgi:Ca2+/Na+ antiporter
VQVVTPILANVIFPAFTAPYFSPLLFPVAGIAAIVTEFMCYRRFSSHPERPSFGDIIGANLVSWLAGIVIGFFLPSGLVHKAVSSGSGRILTQGPHFTTYAIIAFFGACILSIFIEGWFLRWSSRREPEPVTGLYRLSAIANVASYIVLGVLVWIWITWFW